MKIVTISDKINEIHRLFVLICLLFLLICCLHAADIEAGKMEILNTPDGKVTVFKEGVTIIDRETKITAQNARFYENKNLAIVYDSVVIINPSAIIKSDTANYYLDVRKTIFRGNVTVTQESIEIKAPELTVEYKKDRASAKNGFIIIEQPNSIQITGQTGEYFLDKEEGMIDSLPYLEIKKNETLQVFSQKLSFKNKAKSALATGRVKAISGKAVLACDTLIYNWESDSGKASGNPILKENDNEVKGRIIYFLVHEGELDQMVIEGEALGNYYTNQGGKVEISGESLRLFFSEGKTNSIAVKNVRSGKFYRREENRETVN